MRPWMRNVRRVRPYTPGEQPKSLNVTKLNTNENPYPPSPTMLEAINDLTAEDFRRYPDPECTVLTEALAEYFGITRDRVFVGVGSDDVIAMAFMTFFNSGIPIIFPDISYGFYEVWAQMMRIPYKMAPLDADFRMRVQDYMRPNGGIIFPNPNAPTSIAESIGFIEEIVAANPESVVIIDEAYVDFGTNSALPLTEKYDNLLVVQTFSKSRSAAGLRVGFAMGSRELIAALNAVKFSFNSYTMNAAALKLGVATLKDEGYYRECIKKITATREGAVKRLAQYGFTCPEPSANFMLVSNPDIDASGLFEDLRAANIFVRYFDRPRLSDKLRITVGTPEQMGVLYKFLEGYHI